MMRMYAKPVMKRTSLVSQQKIAKTCWGYHSGGSPTWWYDKNGTANGFVSFRIHEGAKCGELDEMLTVTWYQNRQAPGKEVVKDQVVTLDDGSTAMPYNDCYDYLIASGGSQGNPFNGEEFLIKDNDSMV